MAPLPLHFCAGKPPVRPQIRLLAVAECALINVERLSGCPLVLIVDDTLPVRLMMSRILSQAGYRVATAADGASAVALIEGCGPPALVVTDLRMPLMRGEAFARWLARHCPGTPLLFMSGFGPEGDEQLPAALLKKPFTPEALLGAVRRALTRNDPKAGPGAGMSAGSEPTRRTGDRRL